MASGGMDSISFNDGGFFILAASVLCYYDHIITFGDEVRCVWRRRVSGASILFVVNRYVTLTAALASIVMVLPWSASEDELNPSPGPFPAGRENKTCDVSGRVIDACLVIVNIAYVVSASLRLYALYGLSKTVFTVTLLIGMLNPLIQLALMSAEFLGSEIHHYRLGPVGTLFVSGRVNCFHAVISPVGATQFGTHLMVYSFPALRLHGLLFEVIVIVLTWKKTLWNMRPYRTHTPFTTIFLRDGTAYFGIIAIAAMLNTVGMVLYNIISSDTSSTAVIGLALAGPLVDAITSICMSRFLLGLLAISIEHEENGGSQIPTLETLQFAAKGAVITGDLWGGDLDDADVDDMGENDETSVGDVEVGTS